MLGNHVSLWARRKCVGLEWMVTGCDNSPFPGLNCSQSAYSCDMLYERSYLGGGWIPLLDHFLVFSPFPFPCRQWRESRGIFWPQAWASIWEQWELLSVGICAFLNCKHQLFPMPRRHPSMMVPQGESHALNLSLVWSLYHTVTRVNYSWCKLFCSYL